MSLPVERRSSATLLLRYGSRPDRETGSDMAVRCWITGGFAQSPKAGPTHPTDPTLLHSRRHVLLHRRDRLVDVRVRVVDVRREAQAPPILSTTRAAGA